MMENVINKIFNNMISIVCQEIEEEYLEDVQKNYMRVLYGRYSNIDVELNITDYDKLYSVLYENELNEWSNISSSMKKSLLLKDNALEKIINIANQATEYAKLRLETGKFIDKNVVIDYISKMKLLLEQVKDNNKVLANWYFSESCVDLYYASNQTNDMSSRIGYMKK